MRKYILQILTVASLAIAQQVLAGNPDRAGGAGFTQLLVNPYARSGGLMGANTASVRGIESFQFNIAGLAYTAKTDIGISRSIYLQGTDVFINNITLAQALGSGNVIGLSFNSFDFGSIPVTTETQPDGTLGTFSPQALNIALGYAKKFSNSITGGVNVRVLSEGISNVKANGVSMDAGVQYQTSIIAKRKAIKKEDFRFGIGLRNLGPNSQFRGSGLSFRGVNPSTNANRRVYMGSETFNLPTLVNIGVSYDMRLDKKESETYNHKLTGHFNFNYNSFSSNVIGLGLEYSFKEMVMLRAGYGAEEDGTSATDYQSQFIGMSAGVGFALPITKTGTRLTIDYSYAPTRVFNGIHNITLALSIDNNK